jgi:subtilase family serine protease
MSHIATLSAWSPPRKAGIARVLALLALVVALIAATAAGGLLRRGSGAAVHPLVSHPIFVTSARTQLPTTSECLAAFGLHCYTPAQYDVAYNLNGLHAAGIDGTGRTIVIVDAFGSPTIKDDVHQFDLEFGLPDPQITVIQPAGPVPPFDPTNSDMFGWSVETSLDVEWAHAMAPGADILLVETPVSETEGVQGFPEIVKAENYVINHNLGDVISQSFGATEDTFPSPSAIYGLRSAFFNAAAHHVTVLAASGDFGATDVQLNLSDLYTHRVNSWPSSDPLVTSVGGTQLNLDDAGNRLAPDVVWNDGFGAGGGGVSSVFTRPFFQNAVRNVVHGRRGTPDISLSAAVDGFVWVYVGSDPTQAGFYGVGGTSEATPLFAGIVAMADQLAGHRLGLINDNLYAMADSHRSGIVDVTQGNNSFGPFTNTDGNTYTVTGYEAGKGYDLASGLGTIDGGRFVRQLARSGGEGH